MTVAFIGSNICDSKYRQRCPPREVPRDLPFLRQNKRHNGHVSGSYTFYEVYKVLSYLLLKTPRISLRVRLPKDFYIF